MSRLSLVLSVLALIVAVVALAYPRLGEQEARLDQVAVTESVREALRAEPGLIPPAQPAATSTETIGPAVRQYLLENPEVLEEVIAALENKREAAQADAQRDVVSENREQIEAPEFGTAVGNPDGDVTLVEFFDYNCGYCKRMLPELMTLIENDDQLRVVFKEWPVLGEDSQAAARVALVVRQVAPEKYLEFHNNLLSHRGRVGKDEAIAAAEELGIDTSGFEERMAADDVDAALSETFRLGEALGLRGTPSYVVGDKVFMGAVPREQIEAQIADVRENGCLSC